MEMLTQNITLGNDLSNLFDDAKAWVYTCDKLFTESDIKQITELGNVFLSQWDSHGKRVKGTIQILKNRFIAIFADPQGDDMCGRAQDASVKLIKELEQVINKQLMNRMLIAFDTPNGIDVLSMNELRNQIKQGIISDNTNFYNGLITSKKEFLSNWETLIKGSWLV